MPQPTLDIHTHNQRVHRTATGAAYVSSGRYAMWWANPACELLSRTTSLLAAGKHPQDFHGQAWQIAYFMSCHYCTYQAAWTVPHSTQHYTQHLLCMSLHAMVIAESFSGNDFVLSGHRLGQLLCADRFCELPLGRYRSRPGLCVPLLVEHHLATLKSVGREGDGWQYALQVWGS